MLTKIFRYVYLILSWSFLGGVVYQVYTAGLAAVSRTSSWEPHGEFGFLLLLVVFVQLIFVFPARLPRPANWIGLAHFSTVILQLLVMGNRDSTLSALHPVLALLTFSLSWWLARAAWRAVRAPAAAVLQPEGTHA